MSLDKKKLSKTEINLLPLRYYNGAIRIIQTAEQAKNACAILSKEKLLGFDTETRPAFNKGQSYLPSLLQLAGTKVVYLFQLNKCGLPASITNLLSKVNIIKSGVAIGQDLIELQKILNFETKVFFNSSNLSRTCSFIVFFSITTLRSVFSPFLESKVTFIIIGGQEETRTLKPFGTSS